MNKASLSTLVVVFLLSAVPFSFAQEPKVIDNTIRKNPESKAKIMDFRREPVMSEKTAAAPKKSCPMCSMLMTQSMEVAPDGSVIVMVGNKLYKYNSNLELQKEVEIKIDREALSELMATCPICHKMKTAPSSESTTPDTSQNRGHDQSQNSNRI